MSIFADGISGFDESAVTAFDKTLDVFQKLSDAFDETEGKVGWVKRYVKGDSSLSAIGTEIKLFGSSVKSFYDSMMNLSGFKENEINTTNTKVDAVIGVAQAFAVAMKDISVYYSSGFKSFITDLTGLLPDYGEALAQFFVSLNRGFESEGGKSLTPEKVSMLVNATEGFAAIINAVNGLAGLMAYAYDGQSLSDLINTMFGDTVEQNNGLLDINKIAAMITAFDAAFIKVMETEDFAESYKTIGSNIASKMAEGIQAAFDEDESLRIQITPVLKMDELTKAQLRQQLNDEGLTLDTSGLSAGAVGANYQTDLDRVTQSQLSLDLADIKAAIENGPTNALTASDMISAFLGMKVVVYPDVLAGELTDYIDESIGKKIADIENDRAVGPG